MKKKKKDNPQEVFTSPDTNPEMNTDVEHNNEVVTEDDLDLIFDLNTDDETLNDDMLQDNNDTD